MSAGGKLLVFLALLSSILWLESDQLLRDGDELGHLGAAELFLVDLQQGAWLTFWERLLWQDMGDYPSLWPAIVGSWWWLVGGGSPELLRVELITLLPLLGAGTGIFLLLSEEGGRERAWWGAGLVMWLPQLQALSRSYMPEAALAAWVCLSVAFAWRQRRRPGPLNALLLGVSLGCGLLTKQTFLLYILAPLLCCIRLHRSQWLILPGVGLALPWLFRNLAEQAQYLDQSAAYLGGASALDHILYYPRALASLGWGPVWISLGALSLLRGRSSSASRLALLWGLGTVLILTLVPKKYDRLTLPLLPSLALLIAARRTRREGTPWEELFGPAWTLWISWLPSSWDRPPTPLVDFEPGCVQTWMGPPETRDAGLEGVARWLQQHPEPAGPLLVLSDPPIPCSLQTTFSWSQHLGPALRRAGVERAVLLTGEESAELSWIVDCDPSASGELALELPLLETRCWIRSP